MYKNHEFTCKILFSAEQRFANLSFDVEYAIDCIITVDTAEGTAEGFEITRAAVQSGAYDDGETISMSAWSLIDLKKISPKTFSAINECAVQEFFDALEKGGGDGEYESEQFPEIPGTVVSIYEPKTSDVCI